MNKAPEQQKYRTEVAKQNIKLMLAEKQNRSDLANVQKYRKTTGGGAAINDAPILDPELVKETFIS